MNPYDKAHELARILRMTPEYQDFVRIQKQVEQDPQAVAMLKEFFKKQWEAQHEALRGNVDQEKQQVLARMYEFMQSHSSLKDFFAAEMRFGRMVTDIQGILAEAISDGCQLVGKLQDGD